MKALVVSVIVFVLLIAAAEVRADAIWNIRFAPEPVAAMQFNQDVNVTFEYRTDQPGGVRIFARPMAGAVLAPNYAAHPSSVYSPGTGSGTGYFTITAGDVTVDAVRFQVFNADQTSLIMEFYVPVRYHYSAHAIYNIVMTPATPASMQFNGNVDISFNYRSNQPGGVRIFARPISGGTSTPNYAAHGSPLYPSGTGSGTGYFTVLSGAVTVDGVSLQMFNSDQSTLLLEFIVPAEFVYRSHAISDIEFTPGSPEGLVLNNMISATFKYRTTEPGGILIFVRPFTHGNLSSNYGASGSPLYPVGSGTGGADFTITAGEVTIDSVRFRVTTADQSQVLLDYFVPVNFHYAGHRLSNIRFIPPPPAYFTSDHLDTVLYDYATTQVGGVVIFARPFTAGSLSPNYAAHPSPTYAMGSVFGDGWFRILTGSVLVDHVRMQMFNADQSQKLVEWFLPVHF